MKAETHHYQKLPGLQIDPEMKKRNFSKVSNIFSRLNAFF